MGLFGSNCILLHDSIEYELGVILKFESFEIAISAEDTIELEVFLSLVYET